MSGRAGSLWQGAARRLALAGGAIVAAGLVWWAAPWLLEPAGLGEFALLGRLGLTIVTLSVLDRLMARIG